MTSTSVGQDSALLIVSWHCACVSQATTYVMRDDFVLFTFAETKAEVIWFDTLVSDQRLALLHVLHIN